MSRTKSQDQKPFKIDVEASRPMFAHFPATRILQGAGVAIFHIRTKRVVLCYHSLDKYWFLPKGRKDQCETIERAAEREGFEESGYRNRLLPLPLATLQTHPRSHVPHFSRNVTDPVWIELLPQSSTKQYILHWFVAETLPPALESQISEAETADRAARCKLQEVEDLGLKGFYKNSNPWPYHAPTPYPRDLKFKDRIALELDHKDYEPPKHLGTGADSEEALYESYLLDVEDALKNLTREVEQSVVVAGWTAIQKREEIERKAEADGKSEFLFYRPQDDQD